MRTTFILLFFFLLSFSAPLLHAQDERDSSTALGVFAASAIPAAIGTSTYLLNNQAFWTYSAVAPFHLSNDAPYSMHIDKFAHFYFSAIGSNAIGQGYAIAGVAEKTAAWLGAGLTFGIGLLVEAEDARHGNDPQYGFSLGDAGADLVGSALPLLQYYFPELRRVQPKMSIWQSDAYKAGAYKSIADDYESQYYWLSFDVHDLTSTPPWLNIALGFSSENLLQVRYLVPGRANSIPNMDIYLSPDINLKGIPIEGKFWKIFSEVLSYVRIPLPSLQVHPRLKFWWFR